MAFFFLMMMMMMMMVMNCFCGMVDRRKTFSLVSSWDHVRDPHHLESPTCSEQDLNLRRTSVQTCWIKLCSSDNKYTTAPFAPLFHCNSISKRIIDRFFWKVEIWLFFCSIVTGVFDFVYCFKLNTFTSKISDLLLLRELR